MAGPPRFPWFCPGYFALVCSLRLALPGPSACSLRPGCPGFSCLQLAPGLPGSPACSLRPDPSGLSACSPRPGCPGPAVDYFASGGLAPANSRQILGR